MAIELKVKSDSRQAQQDLRKLNKSVENIDRTTKRSADSIKKLAIGTAAAFAAIGSATAITGITDSYRRLEARIALTNDKLEEQIFAFKEINKIAIETRSNQESLADLYSRIGRATKQLGVEQKTVIQVTRSIAQAITISGSSAESANSAIVQLGQGLAAGALRGQELNSVMEQTPAVAQAIARGMGITIGELRAFANEGKLSAQAVIDALEGQGAAIDEEFGKVPVTFAQGLTVLGIGVGRIVNEVDTVLGVSRRTTANFQALGNSLNNSAVGVGNSLSSFLEGFKDFKEGTSGVVSALKVLGTSAKFFTESVIVRLIPTPVLFKLVQLKHELKSMFHVFKELLIPSVRISDALTVMAGKLDLAARAVRLGPFGRLERFLGLSFINTINSVSFAFTKFTTDALRTLLLFSRGIGIAATQIGHRFDAIAVDLRRVGGEIGGIFGESLNVVAEGFDNLGHLFNRFGKATRTLFVETIGVGITVSFLKIAKAINSEVAVVINKAIGLIAKGKTTIAGELFGNAADTFGMMVRKITGFTRKLSSAFSPIKKFVEDVNYAFWWVMDKVVGNSWWPDLIDGVIEYAKLISKAIDPIDKFSNKVSDIFTSLVNKIPDQVKFMATVLADALLPLWDFATGFSSIILSLLDGTKLEVEAVNSLVRFAVFTMLAAFSPILATLFSIVNIIGFVNKEIKDSYEGLNLVADILVGSLREVTNQFDLLKDGSKILSELNEKFGFMDQTVIGLKAIGEILRPILTVLADTFGSTFSAVAATLLAVFMVPFKGLAIIASLLLRDELLSVLNGVLHAFGTNLNDVLANIGDIGGRIAAALAKSIPTILALAGSMFSGIVNGFLDSFGILGDLIRGIFNLVDALTLGFISSLGAATGGGLLALLFLGPKGAFKKGLGFLIKSVKVAFSSTVVRSIFAGAVSGLASLMSHALLLQPALAGVFSFFRLQNFKEMVKGLTLVRVQAMLTSISITGLKASTLGLLASIKAVGSALIAMSLSIVRQITIVTVLAGAQGLLSIALMGLSSVFSVVSVAARLMWIAISGPLAPFMVALLGLIALFSSVGAVADDTTREFKAVENKAHSTRNAIANLFGLGVNLDIKVTPEPKSIEETFDAIDQANERMLYSTRRALKNSYWFDWMSDIATDLDIKLTGAFRAVINGWIDAANSFAHYFNKVFGTSIGFLVKDTRTAVEELLDEIDPALRLKLKLDSKDFDEFTSDEDRGALVATLEKVQLIKKEIATTKDGLFSTGFLVDQKAIANLNGDLERELKLLDAITSQLIRQTTAGQNIRSFTSAYTTVENTLKEVTSLFGEQVVKSKSLVEVAGLNNAEQLKYIELSQQAVLIARERENIEGGGVKNIEARRDALAGNTDQLKEINYQISQIGVEIERQTKFDLVTALGLDEGSVANIAAETLEQIATVQDKIIAKEKIIENLRRTNRAEDTGLINKAQLEIASLKRQGDILVEGAEKSLLTMFDRLSSELTASEVSLDAEEFFKLPESLQERVKDYAAELEKNNQLIADAVDNPTERSRLQKVIADYNSTVGELLNTDIETAQLDNFSRALQPFRELGVNFNADDFNDLGKTFNAEIIAMATDLNAERKILEKQAFDNDADGHKARIEAVAAFNKKIFNLEEATRKAREDALLNDQQAEKLAGGFSKSIVDALHGKADFGESMASLITNHLQEGMTSRIASFAEGFLDSFFSAFEGKGGIGGGLVEMLRGPDNKEKDGLEAKGGSLFDSFGFGSDSKEGGDSLIDDATALPAEGLEKLTGSVAQADAGILGWLGSVGSSIASALGFGTATAVASGTTATAATTTLGFTTALSLATGALMQLASAAMTASMTSGLSFFSTGGYVSGAGTGTSDSIPAMLSNGEYVINAKATKRHGALIKAINNGSDIGRFSTGGQVGNNLPVMSMESQTKRMSGVAPSQKGSTTVNLQVTGDVTEATRKAVRDMGNELSQQVEGNFRERGVLNG